MRSTCRAHRSTCSSRPTCAQHFSHDPLRVSLDLQHAAIDTQRVLLGPASTAHVLSHAARTDGGCRHGLVLQHESFDLQRRLRVLGLEPPFSAHCVSFLVCCSSSYSARSFTGTRRPACSCLFVSTIVCSLSTVCERTGRAHGDVGCLALPATSAARLSVLIRGAVDVQPAACRSTFSTCCSTCSACFQTCDARCVTWSLYRSSCGAHRSSCIMCCSTC
jgi:hypothetical protein